LYCYLLYCGMVGLCCIAICCIVAWLDYVVLLFVVLWHGWITFCCYLQCLVLLNYVIACFCSVVARLSDEESGCGSYPDKAADSGSAT